MKHRFTFMVTMAIFAFASLAIAPASHAALAPVGDSGVVALKSGQVLRVTINLGSGNDTIRVAVRSSVYSGAPTSGIWKSTIVSQHDFTNTVLDDESASIDIAPTGGTAVRAVVFTNNQNVRITGEVINGTTGEVEAMITMTEVLITG